MGRVAVPGVLVRCSEDWLLALQREAACGLVEAHGARWGCVADGRGWGQAAQAEAGRALRQRLRSDGVDGIKPLCLGTVYVGTANRIH